MLVGMYVLEIFINVCCIRRADFSEFENIETNNYCINCTQRTFNYNFKNMAQFKLNNTLQYTRYS